MENLRGIKIVTNFQNNNLFKITKSTFPYPIYTIYGKYGLYGLSSIFFAIEKLKHENLEWLIFIDEDTIVFNPMEIESIIDFMKIHQYDVAGVRDGGVVSHRLQNPYCVNNHFLIINFRKVINIFNKNVIMKNQYIGQDEFKEDLTKLPYKYNEMSLFEHYYCFHFWALRNNLKYYYIDSVMHNDGISNILLNNNIPFLIHTWYSRKYKYDEFHRKRIDRIIEDFIPKLTFQPSTIELTSFYYRSIEEINFQFKRIYKGINRRLKLKS